MTIEEITNRHFKRKVRGYDEIEVDAHLEKVAAECEASFKRCTVLEERVKALESDLSSYRAMDRTLRETLLNAQRSADETVQRAEDSAATLVRSAEEQAREILANAQSEMDNMSKEARELQEQFDHFRQEAIMVMRRQIDLFSQALEHQV